MTIVAPWGVWQCSDQRAAWVVRNQRTGELTVIRTDDSSVKHIQFQCRDGAALLAYSGLSTVGTDDFSDWLRRLLRGQSRTVAETLIRIRAPAARQAGGLLTDPGEGPPARQAVRPQGEQDDQRGVHHQLHATEWRGRPDGDALVVRRPVRRQASAADGVRCRHERTPSGSGGGPPRHQGRPTAQRRGVATTHRRGWPTFR